MAKILVVDDVADNVKLLAYELSDQDHEILTAYSGPEALDAARSNRPDVILLDVMMPGMDGVEVCRRLKADPELRPIPVIMVSARDQEDDIVRGLDAGAQDYVTKPFNLPMVLARVRSAVRAKASYDLVARLHAQMEQARGEVTLAYDATIEGWARALDLRDKETEGHTRRVTEMALHLARAMGVSEADLVHVRRGALLHDVGKLGIPDEVLLKPGPLTEAEWEVMRRHPTYAYSWLASIPYLQPALAIPYCHHERWDGTGYPRGLKGEQIPLAARIFAAVDIWDALRSDRPYRRALPREQVLEHVASLSGTHLDPEVVRVFLRTFGEPVIDELVGPGRDVLAGRADGRGTPRHQLPA
ncbi:MAG TPA: HD domain-containing phosphohydrolase [Gemmataceae bacterium]|nr:HD domain-containing phosphohydrolase [Gemmataceae bacterium]